MDYDILNGAIDDIVWIVNQYNKTRGYDVDVCENLLLALVGYYLSFGPEIFNKIDKVLDVLKIYQCASKEECAKVIKKLFPQHPSIAVHAGTIWDFKYTDLNNSLIGAIPNIVYCNSERISNVLSMIHELSHSLEGVTAIVLGETRDELRLKQGFAEYTVDKKTSIYTGKGRGMTELITITVENKAIREYIKLNPAKVNNPLVKSFIEDLGEYKDRNFIVKSYPVMAALYKDLIDNETFFGMIKRYYYETEQEAFSEEFNSLDERLNFKRLASYADKVYEDNFDAVLYYTTPIQKQIEAFSKATGSIPDKRMIFLI